MMVHHVSVGVRDVAEAAKFYDKIFRALGYRQIVEMLPYAVAYGDGMPEFWVGLPHDQQAPSAGNGAHFSFSARSKGAVQKFHAAAIEAGGSDDGAPGPRPDYGPEYYGAFVRDPDGNKLEAVLVMAAPAEAAKKAAAKTKAAAKKTSAKKAPAKKAAAKPAKAKAKGGKVPARKGKRR